MGEEKLQHSTDRGGTLAIDLGSTTTVVAFQSPDTPTAQLVELSPISRRPGEVPSLVWDNGDQPLIGRQVIEAGLDDSDDPKLPLSTELCCDGGPYDNPVEKLCKDGG